MSDTMTTDLKAPHAPHPKATRWAWSICWLMFACTVLNYMDRQAIALVGPQIRRQFGVDFEGFGWVLTAFGLSYALFQIPAGFAVDRFDVRRIYPGAVGLWSIAAIAGAFSPTLGALIALRALLGVGESFNWPCALRMTREILPPRDRGLGNGIFNSGAAVGAVLTPLSIPILTKLFGWQIAFVILGALGFVWVAAWQVAMRFAPMPEPAASENTAAAESPRRFMGARARVAYFSVVALAALVIALGAFLPVRVPVSFESIRVSQPITLQAWLVSKGQAIRRNQPIAHCTVGADRFALVSRTDGRFVEPLISPGTTIERGHEVYVAHDAISPVVVRLDLLKPLENFWLIGWLKKPGTLLKEGDALAWIECPGGARGAVISPIHCRVAEEVFVFYKTLTPADPMLLLEVRGFHAQAWGLPAVWVGAAILMVGVLLASLLVPLNELGTGWSERLGRMVRLERFWILVVVSCTINLAWHFLVNWLPTYLQTDRNMTYLASGLFAALPFLAADAGNLGGGAMSRWLAGRGLTPARARIVVMSACVALVQSGAWVGLVPTVPAWEPFVLALLCLMALGAAGYMANYFAFCQEVSGPLTGLVVGYLGGLGNLIAAGFNPVAGRLKDTTGSFGGVFAVVGLAPLAGLLLLAFCWRERTSAAETAQQSD